MPLATATRVGFQGFSTRVGLEDPYQGMASAIRIRARMKTGFSRCAAAPEGINKIVVIGTPEGVP